jgi:hypothetical protein
VVHEIRGWYRGVNHTREEPGTLTPSSPYWWTGPPAFWQVGHNLARIGTKQNNLSATGWIIHKRSPLTVILGEDVTECVARVSGMLLASVGFNSEVKLTIGNKFDGISVGCSPGDALG